MGFPAALPGLVRVGGTPHHGKPAVYHDSQSCRDRRDPVFGRWAEAWRTCFLASDNYRFPFCGADDDDSRAGYTVDATAYTAFFVGAFQLGGAPARVPPICRPDFN